jgi:hypothetical protein
MARARFKAGTAGDQIALPAILTINPISAVLNTNDVMSCTVRRMTLSVMPTSETCAMTPTACVISRRPRGPAAAGCGTEQGALRIPCSSAGLHLR